MQFLTNEIKTNNTKLAFAMKFNPATPKRKKLSDNKFINGSSNKAHNVNNKLLKKNTPLLKNLITIKTRRNITIFIKCSRNKQKNSKQKGLLNWL